ncbi:nuclear transcription factor Y subunit C-1-like [Solanum verrucosum]|uniref:nuclear transcription factor Y subunit C-1-like n=1 Tax=Solanum verrucosum TaxID=315347 RepID=UPI0020D1CB80|nr:nuclear transcription factor Y subunit C-1-like [Solanum verrucosum]
MENNHQQPMENNHQQSAEPLYPGYPLHQMLMLQQHEQLQLQQQQQVEEQMRIFWNCQREEIEELDDFKHHQFPISRIKRIIKSENNVLKVSAETPILFSKACELFILELTLRSWFHAQENNRGTLKKTDFAAAIRRTEIFDFLADVVPADEINEVATGFGPGMVGPTAGGGFPYFYPPMGQLAMPGVMLGGPAMPGVMPGGLAMPGPILGGPAMPDVMIGGPAMPVVAPSVYVQPPLQAWQPAGDNSNAGGGNGGQGNFGP